MLYNPKIIEIPRVHTKHAESAFSLNK